MSARVCIGLGGNVGDRGGHLAAGLAALADAGTEVLGVSSVWESEYVGPGRQDPYLNACAVVRTDLDPLALLACLQRIERRAGREPDAHMQPRPLDLDIILYGDRVLEGPDLQVPHPRARQRAFVLEPLAEVAAGMRFADSGETVAAACAKLRGTQGPWVRIRDDMSLAGGRAG